MVRTGMGLLATTGGFVSFALAFGVCTGVVFGVGGPTDGGFSAASVAAQPVPAALYSLVNASKGKLTERQCFQLAKKAIVEGRAYRNAWFKAGHRIDYVSPRYFAVAGKCYAKAVALVQKQLVMGTAVSKAGQAEAIARFAWWRFRNADASEYPKIVLELQRAVKLNPHKAIYWVMLSTVTWRQELRPCLPQWTLAVKYLQTAVRINPKCAIAYFQLGELIAGGPHYNLPRKTYNLKQSEIYYKLCYANRRHFNRFYYYYSDTWIRDSVWNIKEALGIVPPNTVPPKSGDAR